MADVLKALVFGSTGQVARELVAACPQDIALTLLSRAEADLTKPDACHAAIMAQHPDMVINAAAYTAVDRAEEEEGIAMAVNAKAPAAMAEATTALGIPLVHISTDYVFPGAGETPWKPNDKTAPLSAYGRSKLAGEDAIRASNGTYAILRTSWVFSAHGANFVKTMLRLGRERDRLTIVADQIGGPTPARAIAEACFSIASQLTADPDKSGTYHFSGAPDVSWADFAREIFRQASISCSVEDIPTSAYPTPAKRPLNSRLDCTSLLERFAISRPNWRDGLAQVLKELSHDQS